MSASNHQPDQTRQPRRRLLVGAIGALLLVSVTVAVTTDGRRSASSTTGQVDILVNGGFEFGLAAWRTTNGNQQPLIAALAPRSGDRSMLLAGLGDDADLTLESDPGWTPRSQAQQGYRLTAWVRTTDDTAAGSLRLREAGGSRALDVGSQPFIASTTWQKVTLAYVAHATGSALEVALAVQDVPLGVGLLVDDVSLTTGSRHARVQSPPQPDGVKAAPQLAEPCAGNPLGLTPAGAYVGAAVTGTSSLTLRELQFGASLPLHRRYYRGDDVSRAVAEVSEDLMADRLPWISFKLPYSWGDMAAGAGDAWAMDLVTRLEALDGPVWLAFHHEPEHDGDMAAWIAMQQRLAALVHDHSDSLAFSIILTGWETFDPSSPYYIERLWPGDEVVDLVGVDPYNWFGATIDGRTVTEHDDVRPTLAKLAAWTEARGVPWAVAETGLSDAAYHDDPDWLAETYAAVVSLGGIAMAYFDSSLSPLADFQLDDPGKREALHELLSRSPRTC
jgi:hypothetical protein